MICISEIGRGSQKRREAQRGRTKEETGRRIAHTRRGTAEAKDRVGETEAGARGREKTARERKTETRRPEEARGVEEARRTEETRRDDKTGNYLSRGREKKTGERTGETRREEEERGDQKETG